MSRQASWASLRERPRLVCRRIITKAGIVADLTDLRFVRLVFMMVGDNGIA